MKDFISNTIFNKIVYIFVVTYYIIMKQYLTNIRRLGIDDVVIHVNTQSSVIKFIFLFGALLLTFTFLLITIFPLAYAIIGIPVALYIAIYPIYYVVTDLIIKTIHL